MERPSAKHLNKRSKNFWILLLALNVVKIITQVVLGMSNVLPLPLRTQLFD